MSNASCSLCQRITAQYNVARKCDDCVEKSKYTRRSSDSLKTAVDLDEVDFKFNAQLPGAAVNLETDAEEIDACCRHCCMCIGHVFRKRSVKRVSKQRSV